MAEKTEGGGAASKGVTLVNAHPVAHLFTTVGKISPGEQFTVPEPEAKEWLKTRKAIRAEDWTDEQAAANAAGSY